MRLVRNILWALAAWLVSGLVIHIPSFFISGVFYPALCEWFPLVFIDYSPVLSPDEYATLSCILDMLSSTVTIFIISYFCVRLDNERMEYMITRTEGLYTARQGMEIYYPRYLPSDVTVAVLVPLPLVIADQLLPREIPELISPMIDYLFSFTRGYTDILGPLLGALLMCLTVLISRLISGALSLRTWQAIWLSDIE